MTQTDHKLLGSAARVAELFAGKLAVHDLYGPSGAHLYHNFTLRDDAEIDELLDLAGQHRGPVLELACGSGRITLPLLRQGYQVQGLDFSPHMLGLLQERLAEPENRQLAGQLHTVEGDMTAFSLGRRFSVIVLGATAIWNLDEDGRASLFASVRGHLEQDGRFLFTVLTFTGLAEATEPMENIAVFPARDDQGPVLCTLFDYVEPSGQRCTTILCQRVAGGEVAGTSLYTAWSYLASPEALTEEVRRAGLDVVAVHEVTGRHRITRGNTAAGRRRLLFEVALPN